MHRSRSLTPWCLAAALVSILGCAHREPVQARHHLERVAHEASREQLVAFESAEALQTYVEQLHGARSAYGEAIASDGDGSMAVYAFEDSEVAGESLAPQGAFVGNRSVTNTQEAAVDEGGIVKMIGDHLVVLRRGRLFSVSLAGARPQPVDAIDIAPVVGHDAWYDELLVLGNTAIVLGYSYDTMGSEILRFRLDAAGRWQRVGAWVLRASDYYSSRNYASRLVGERLVMYSQAPLQLERGRVQLPELARWGGGHLTRKRWVDVMTATDVHRPLQPTTDPVLHLVMACDLRAADLQCESQGIVGPWSRSFYVSATAVHVWVHDDALGQPSPAPLDPAEPAAVLYRLPFDGAGLGALRAHGGPIDQFSFQERGDALAVVLRANGHGDGMFAAERHGSEDLSLLRVSVSALAAGVAVAEPEAFTPLPSPGSTARGLVNRFVGEHLLYGQGDPWWSPAGRTPAVLHVVRWVDPQPEATALAMPHDIERIEALGEHALVVGGDREDLHLSSVALDPHVRVVDRHVEKGVAQGETRSHGFFFAPTGRQRGILGLPVRAGDQPGWAHLVDGSTGVAYLAVDQLSLAPLGALASDPGRLEDDRCVTSCIDWYGSSRPLFIDDRVLALLGYELVEGRVRRGRITEVSRADLLAALPRRPSRRE